MVVINGARLIVQSQVDISPYEYFAVWIFRCKCFYLQLIRLLYLFPTPLIDVKAFIILKDSMRTKLNALQNETEINEQIKSQYSWRVNTYKYDIGYLLNYQLASVF